MSAESLSLDASGDRRNLLEDRRIDEEWQEEEAMTMMTFQIVPMTFVLVIFLQVAVPVAVVACRTCIRPMAPDPDDMELDEVVTAKRTDAIAASTKKVSTGCPNCRFPCRAVSAFWYLSWWICMIYIVISSDWLETPRYGRSIGIIRVLAIVCAIVLHVAIFVETLFCSENGYLQKTQSRYKADQLIQTMRTTGPSISLKACGWKARPGFNIQTANRSLLVNTVVEQPLIFADWKDESGDDIFAGNDGTIIRLAVKKVLKFADAPSKAAYEDAFIRFQETYSRLDENVDCHIVFHVQSFETDLVVYNHRASCKCPWIGPTHLKVAAAVGLGWPYRWLLAMNTSRSVYSVVKTVSLPPQPENPSVQQRHVTPAVYQTAAFAGPNPQMVVVGQFGNFGLTGVQQVQYPTVQPSYAADSDVRQPLLIGQQQRYPLGGQQCHPGVQLPYPGCQLPPSDPSQGVPYDAVAYNSAPPAENKDSSRGDQSSSVTLIPSAPPPAYGTVVG